jgi:hypothetical protein
MTKPTKNKNMGYSYMSPLKTTKTQQKMLNFLNAGVTNTSLTRGDIRDLGFNSKREYFQNVRIMYNSLHSDISKMNKSLAFKRYENIGFGYDGYKMNIRRQYQECIAYDFADATFFDTIERKIRNKIKQFRKGGNVKGYTNMLGYRNGSRSDTLTFGTKAMTLNNDCEIVEFLSAVKREYQTLFRGYMQNVSGVTSFALNLHNYTAFSGSSYTELPKAMLHKKAIVNIKNEDALCFLYSVLAHLFPAKHHGDRLSNYKKYINELKYDGIEMPMKVSDIERFEAKNELVINVYTYNTMTKDIEIVYHSKGDKEPINLFLYNKHYSLIRHWKRFTNKDGECKHYCNRCFQSFRTPCNLQKHMVDCKQFDACTVEMPEDDESICFTNEDRKYKYPVAVYADFESTLPTCSSRRGKDKIGKHTMRLQRHKSVSYMFKICGDNLPPNMQTVYKYTGSDADEHFVKTLQELQDTLIIQAFPNNTMENLTAEEKMSYYKCRACPQCKISFTKTEEKCNSNKCRDHNHITGKFRGALCRECNLQNGKKESRNRFIPIFFHNLKGYDAHHIFRAFQKVATEKDNVDCIPLNSEKYISFSFNKFRFLDSAAFLNSSLDNLLGNLDDEHKHHLKARFGDCFEFVNKKGHFPYSWFDSTAKLKRKSLPPIEKWHNDLSDEPMKAKDYEFVQRVWKHFDMKTFEDYHDLYLEIDVLGLADLFEQFREISLNDYDLDPVYYYTLPGFSWDAMLKKTGVDLELLTDVNMYTFLERGIRGGVSVQSHRHAKANNKYMKDHDPTKESNYLIYVDANNLYGDAMKQQLPVSDFKWMEDIPPDDVPNLSDCILEVDVEYPKELHDLHNDYPLLPANGNIKEVEISEYSRGVMNQNDNKFQTDNRKLLGTLKDKKNYVIHIETLKYAVSKGLKVTKIHKGISFKSSGFLGEYIDYNSNMRAHAKNDFEKDFYKLMNNAVFGKTMENLRSRVNVAFCTSEKTFKREVRKHNFKRKLFGDDKGNFFVGLEMHVKKVKLNKPIALGFSILEYSKLHMQRFHYDNIKPKYGEKATLLFTDTDSFCYDIKTEDLYKDIAEDSANYDLSNYPKDHAIYDATNKKVVGKFKDELGGEIMTEFVGLKSKVYSFVKEDGVYKNTLKGINRSVAKKQIHFDDYKNTLMSGLSMRHEVTRIVSKKHEMYTIKQNKISLSAYDDKRYIKPDGVSTYAYGHYKTTQMN